MIKKLFFISIFCLCLFHSFSQSIAGFSAGVNILSDSSSTTMTRIQEFMDRIRMIQEAVNQVKNTYDVLQAQLQAIESLGKGDLDGFSQAISYEQQSISKFNKMINGFDHLKEIDSLKTLLDSEDFNAFKVDVQCLDDAARTSGEFLQDSIGLIKNSADRIADQTNIQERSKTTSSITGQLQLQQQSMNNLSGELEDILISASALNNATLTQQRNDQIKGEILKKRADQILLSEDLSIYDAHVTDQEYENKLFNITN